MQYTTENTEGYSAYDLANLNRIYEQRIALLDEDERESLDYLQHISEQVLSEYDSARGYGGGWADYQGRIYGLTQQAYYYGRCETSPGFGFDDAYSALAVEIETGRSARVYWRTREDYDPEVQEEDDACDWDRPDHVEVWDE